MDPGFRRDNSPQPLRAARLLELDGAAGVLDLLLPQIKPQTGSRSVRQKSGGPFCRQ